MSVWLEFRILGPNHARSTNVCVADRFASGTKVHTDDMPLPVIAPGHAKTKTGQLWVYVRDVRPSGSTEAPALIRIYAGSSRRTPATAPFRLQGRTPGRRVRRLSGTRHGRTNPGRRVPGTCRSKTARSACGTTLLDHPRSTHALASSIELRNAFLESL